PTSMILSARLMLDWLGEADAARRVEAAVYKTLTKMKVVTRDLGGTAGTTEMAEEISKNIRDL
ncbi:MAG: hypothetical protein LUQ00_00890, partial [Candidatus Methanomethyliaceae archaeon]|nr:hypothetical protein [Candidatus Methanomethyliaceae archaeon]